jgi:subtilisin family serine protease
MDDQPVIAFHAEADQLAKLKRSPRVKHVAADEERELPKDVVDAKLEPKPITDAAPRGGATGEGVAPAATSNYGFTQSLAAWWDYYRIGVDKATARGYTGAGQTVAILDTGVDRNHSWLQGDVVREACYSTRTLGYTGGDCPNGYWTQTGLGSARPCLINGCAHGTHVAHTAAGKYGVAPGANIIAVQVFHHTSQGPMVYDSDLTWGLKFVYDLRGTYRIAAANMSLGGWYYTSYCDNSFAVGSASANVGGWFKSLKAVGIAPVVASGNDNYSNAVGQPACFSAAVSVGNTTLTSTGADAVFGNASYYDAQGRIAWTGSNANSTLDLLAPGTDICSAIPNNQSACWYGGTSMAAPHVAGAFATLRQARPTATVDQVQSALHRSGVSVSDSRQSVPIVRTRIHVDNGVRWIWSV